MLDNAILFVYDMGEVKEMSETKLCPFITPIGHGPDGQEIYLSPPSKWGNCVQDKCAMWRITTVVVGHEVVDHDGPLGKIYENVGYCGLAGKP